MKTGFINRRHVTEPCGLDKNACTLDFRRILVLPTWHGLLFFFVIILMLIASVNYQLNLGYVMTFLLFGLMLIGILHTYRNLYGLSLRVGRLQPAYAGEPCVFPIIVSHTRALENLSFQWHHMDMVSIDVKKHEETSVAIPVLPKRRGWFRPGRIRIATIYPLGWFCAWCMIDFDCEIIVYPKPKAAGPYLPSRQTNIAQAADYQAHCGDDFHGLQAYQRGDSLRHVAWRAYAQEKGLYTKKFVTHVSQALWLDWEMLDDNDKEIRLGKLCQWVNDATEANLTFGLRLPNQIIEQGCGASHQRHCLTALALYDEPQP